MASKFDKSLEEIIREKGIQNPTIKKKKTQTQTPKFLKTISKKSYWQKIANEDGKTFEAPEKCSVKITGLANSVNWNDLQELFNPFGQGMKPDVKMHYSTSGIFMGSAEVILPNRKLALRAAEAYNNVQMDNSTMTVVVEGNDPENEMVSYIPEPAKKSKEPTVEELDAEMDKYHQNKGGQISSRSERKLPYFYQNNEVGEKEMPRVEDLDAEMEEYMGKTRI